MRGLEMMIDNGGRRSGFDRRLFSYSAHIPERRSSHDRRCRKDRRYEISPRLRADRRVRRQFAMGESAVFA